MSKVKTKKEIKKEVDKKNKIVKSKQLVKK